MQKMILDHWMVGWGLFEVYPRTKWVYVATNNTCSRRMEVLVDVGCITILQGLFTVMENMMMIQHHDSSSTT